MDNLHNEMRKRLDEKRAKEKAKLEQRKAKFLESVIEKEKRMTNQELFYEVVEQSGGDDYDGCFTESGRWEFDYLFECLEKRLSNWFDEDKIPF